MKSVNKAADWFRIHIFEIHLSKLGRARFWTKVSCTSSWGVTSLAMPVKKQVSVNSSISRNRRRIRILAEESCKLDFKGIKCGDLIDMLGKQVPQASSFYFEGIFIISGNRYLGFVVDRCGKRIFSMTGVWCRLELDCSISSRYEW